MSFKLINHIDGVCLAQKHEIKTLEWFELISFKKCPDKSDWRLAHFNWMDSFALLCDESSCRWDKSHREKMPNNQNHKRWSQNNFFLFVAATTAHVSFVISTYFFFVPSSSHFTFFLHWLQFPFGSFFSLSAENCFSIPKLITF